jgi:hypothetical protein
MRFSIRDILWLTALAALAACWFSDRRIIFEMKDRLKAEQDVVRAEQDLARTEAAASQEARDWYRHNLDKLDAAARLYEQRMPPPTQMRRDD